MRFEERLYDVYVILASPTSTPAWEWPVWQKVSALWTPLLQGCRKPNAVRTTQVAGRKKIAFGRLGWNQKDHQKWTHGSSQTVDRCRDWKFIGAEVWSPSWTACEKEHKAPDFFLRIINECLFTNSTQKVHFNQKFVIAAAADLSEEFLALARQATTDTAQQFGAVRVLYQRRPWGFAWGSGLAFTGAIQELGTIGLFKPGRLHDRPLDEGAFSEKWTFLPTA
jgi:hypothetical protein